MTWVISSVFKSELEEFRLRETGLGEDGEKIVKFI
jgi:hypothetical protein